MSRTPRSVLVKVGGELLADGVALAGVAGAISAAGHHGVAVTVVHGGGPQVSALQRRLGLEPTLVAGRRVTDQATLEVVAMVLAGKVNTELVAALAAHGVSAVGLSGADGGVLAAHRRPPLSVTVNGQRSTVDYGHVGDIDGVNASLLETLLGSGYVPVICSLTADERGSLLNVNADTAAAAVAAALGVERLVVLTGVAGVYRDFAARRGVIELLTPAAARAAIADGTVAGGMAPKLEACARAVEEGVGEAVIVDGTQRDVVRAALTARGVRGTAIRRPAGAAARSA